MTEMPHSNGQLVWYLPDWSVAFALFNCGKHTIYLWQRHHLFAWNTWCVWEIQTICFRDMLLRTTVINHLPELRMH